MEVISRQKAISLGLKRYFTGKLCKHGHLSIRIVINGSCNKCLYLAPNRKINIRNRMRKFRLSLSEEKKLIIKQKTKAYLVKNKEIISEKRKARYIARKDDELANARIYKLKHKEKLKAQVKEYHKKNHHLLLEINALRRAAQYKATPSWLTKQHRKEIREIYKKSKEMGTGYHVDHIVPLQGKIVSGLHVPWNLQILIASENIRKKNKHAA